MECLLLTVSYHIFMNNFLAPFCLLTHLGVNNVWAKTVLNKTGFPNALTLETNSSKKKERGYFEQRTPSKKSSTTLTVVDWNNKRAVYIAPSKSSKPEGLVRYLNKVERKYIQEHQRNLFHCYNQSICFYLVLFDRMDQNLARNRAGIQIRNCWQSLFVSIVDVILQNAWVLYLINKGEGDESLPLIAFRRGCQSNFSEKFRARQIIFEWCNNSRCPISCLLWWQKFFW